VKVREFIPGAESGSRKTDEWIAELDERLGQAIADGLGRTVFLVEHDGENSSDRPWYAPALATVGDLYTEPKQAAADDEVIRQAISLSAGTVAWWNVTASECDRVARHAQTIIDLHNVRNENGQLTAEVDSLASQVMNDFEELSLIRSLVTSFELPKSQDEIRTFVLSSMKALAQGVGAESIAAVLIDPSTQARMPALWTDDPLLDDPSIDALIDRYEEHAKTQPVIENDVGGVSICPQQTGSSQLKELLLVQCSSESRHNDSRQHGWILACNRSRDTIAHVPWAQLGFTTVQASLLETASSHLASQLSNIRLLRQKEELFTDVIRALVNAVEARDTYTCGHSERVARFARHLGKTIGFTTADCERIYLSGLLHDVGKIAVPDQVLQKSGRLTEQEHAIITTHPDSGWQILQELGALQDVVPGVLYHHEQWNGEGYPDRLEGENIPIDARILAVCDAFDAMTSDRTYRKGMSVDKALQILRDGAGRYWDPTLVERFIDHFDEFEEIRRTHRPRQKAERPAPIGGHPMVGSTHSACTGKTSSRTSLEMFRV
jgi:HD-GYP domain-containing protein (c-di-GMP phosphodiesterase class II)